MLLACAVAALLVASSRHGESYLHFWHRKIALEIAGYRIERSFEWVVNDALMAIFFFVVGMEIRREAHRGVLSDPRRAALPAAGALGGMLLPVAIYLLVAGSSPLVRVGWSVPMATDIAFAVGVLALLGKRVPPSLRVLLLALAVLDDLGAIVVITFFYSKGFRVAGVGVAALGLAVLLALRVAGVRAKLAYVVPAVVIWAGTAMTGIHPTMAGVVVGLLTPVRARLASAEAGKLLAADAHDLSLAGDGLGERARAALLRRIDAVRREVTSPADALIATLTPWVGFVVMPLFALANACVPLGGPPFSGAAKLGLVAAAVGLFLGKPVGIWLACALAIRLRIAKLPGGLDWKHVALLGLVAGIGFTMAIFVAQLAFSDVAVLRAVKLGVLGASGGAGVVALIVGRVILPPVPTSPSVESSDDADPASRVVAS